MSAQAEGGGSVILTICAIGGLFTGLVGTVLSIYNLHKAHNKEKREEELKASLNLVKAEYRQGTTRFGKLATYLYVVNSDIRPVSNVRVEFFNKNGVAAPKEYPSLVFGEECCVDFCTSRQLQAIRAKFVYTDFDGRVHRYDQDHIHDNPHHYTVAT